MFLKEFLSRTVVKFLIVYDVVLILLILFIFCPVSAYAAETENTEESGSTRWYAFDRYGTYLANYYGAPGQGDYEYGHKVDGYIGVPSGYVPVLVDYDETGSKGMLYLVSTDSGYWFKVADLSSIYNVSGNYVDSTDVDKSFFTSMGTVYVKMSFDLTSPYTNGYFTFRYGKAYFDNTYYSSIFSYTYEEASVIPGSPHCPDIPDGYGLEFSESEYSSLEELQSSLLSLNYDSPVINDVKSLYTVGKNRVIGYEFVLSNCSDDVTAIVGDITVNCTNLKGDTYDVSIPFVEFGSLAGSLSNIQSSTAYYVINKTAMDNALYLNTDNYGSYLKSIGYDSDVEIDTVTLEISYKYGNVTSQKSTYVYSFSDGVLIGEVFSSGSQSTVPVDNITNDKSEGLHTSIDEETTIGSIFDTLTELLDTVVVGIKSLFDMVKTVLSSSLGFVKYLGNFIGAFAGTEVGSVITIGFLFVVSIGVFKLIRG